jgi:hypothetical protein
MLEEQDLECVNVCKNNFVELYDKQEVCVLSCVNKLKEKAIQTYKKFYEKTVSQSEEYKKIKI